MPNSSSRRLAEVLVTCCIVSYCINTKTYPDAWTVWPHSCCGFAGGNRHVGADDTVVVAVSIVVVVLIDTLVVVLITTEVIVTTGVAAMLVTVVRAVLVATSEQAAEIF
jgi:hypothetical protein